MSKLPLRAGLFLWFAACVPAIAAAAPARGRVATVTRLVKLFLDKEAAIGNVIRSADAAGLAAILTDDFEVRTGPRAASPIPRDDWMREVLRSRDPGGEVSRMAVHDYGAVAIASFTQDGASGTMFVVDVWRAQGSDWKLAVRYASAAGSPTFAIPGAGVPEPEIPKKY